MRRRCDRSCKTILDKITHILSTASQGELLAFRGLKVAIIGQPNVGKSSLFECLESERIALLSPTSLAPLADVVESQLIVGGIPVQVLDTAGIRESVDEVEKIGIERSQSAAQSADLVLLTLDATQGWTLAEQALYDRN